MAWINFNSQLYTDNGGEYKSLDSYLSFNGIERLLSPSYTSQRATLAECHLWHLAETSITSNMRHLFLLILFFINSSPLILGYSRDIMLANKMSLTKWCTLLEISVKTVALEQWTFAYRFKELEIHLVLNGVNFENIYEIWLFTKGFL